MFSAPSEVAHWPYYVGLYPWILLSAKTRASARLSLSYALPMNASALLYAIRMSRTLYGDGKPIARLFSELRHFFCYFPSDGPKIGEILP